jgi:hypothetical protein
MEMVATITISYNTINININTNTISCIHSTIGVGMHYNKHNEDSR